MKQNVDLIEVQKEEEFEESVASFLSSSQFIIPFEDHLVEQLRDYRAFDVNSAFIRLKCN